MSYTTVLQNIASVIQDYMDLPAGVVYLKDQKHNLPKSDDFTISVGFMGIKPMGSSVETVIGSSTTAEKISTNMMAQVSIDILGRSFDVMTRAPEIIAALGSSACKEDQAKNSYGVWNLPLSMNDISGLDGAAIPYRFQTVFNVQFVHSRTKDIDYYNVFALGTILTEG